MNKLNRLNKYNREKIITKRRISGGLKQTINAHGPITLDLIPSASKRIYGALLSNKPKKKKYKLIISFLLGVITSLIITNMI